MNLEAVAFEFGRAGRVPGDGPGGIKTDAGVGPAHGFVYRTCAVQKVSIGGGEANWPKTAKARGSAEGSELNLSISFEIYSFLSPRDRPEFAAAS